MKNLEALTIDQLAVIVRNYQTLVHLILVHNQELGQDIANTPLNRAQLDLIRQWQADCVKAVETAGDAMLAGIEIAVASKDRGTH